VSGRKQPCAGHWYLLALRLRPRRAVWRPARAEPCQDLPSSGSNRRSTRARHWRVLFVAQVEPAT